MERKLIGSFIAVLRKANGLTQKDLAEKLNVSDKSISRWERNDGSPDLSLIPVIAEIFNVTCDELLRGERQATPPSEPQSLEKSNFKAEKQRQRILSASLSKYRNRSLIALGLAILGLIAAMLCNFGFNRAYIGFLAGAVFYLAAIICQAIFINGAFLAVADDELIGTEVERFKRLVVSLGEKAISLPIVLLATSLPLIIYPTDTFMALNADSWLLLGALFGMAGIFICGIFCYFLTDTLQKRGIYTLSGSENIIYQHNFKLKRTCALALSAVLFVTFLGNAVAIFGADISSFAEGVVFDDYASFKEYMAQDIPGKSYGNEAPVAVAPGSEHYYDEHGNEVTQLKSLTRTIEDRDGNVVCQYLARNKSVQSIRWGHTNGEILPITTFSEDDVLAANHGIALRKAIFACVYLFEIATTFFVYLKKRTHQ